MENEKREGEKAQVEPTFPHPFLCYIKDVMLYQWGGDKGAHRLSPNETP
jgi:hypothetical protein